MSDHDIPRERDLPPGRLAQMKDDLMAQIEDTDRHDPTDPRVVDLTPRPRWRRAGVAAAVAVAAGVAVTGVLAVRGGDSASASPNFAEPTAEGFVRIHLEDLDDPEQVEQDLADLGVTAELDVFEGGGWRCAYSRSDSWKMEPTPGLFPSAYEDDPADDKFDFALDPDALQQGETLVIEFFWDEHEGEWVTGWGFRVSTSPVGECDPVEDPAVIVDAENQIIGG